MMNIKNKIKLLLERSSLMNKRSHRQLTDHQGLLPYDLKGTFKYARLELKKIYIEVKVKIISLLQSSL